jgi:ribosome-associated heat shock protein Hsp15
MTARAPPPSLRLDKWLWFARFAKTRSLAAKLCSTGAVTLGAVRGAPKPHHPLRIGDLVTLRRGRTIVTVRVRTLGTRRGPAPEARQLYDALDPPQVAPIAEWEPLLLDPAGEEA